MCGLLQDAIKGSAQTSRSWVGSIAKLNWQTRHQSILPDRLVHL